jgi:hypothetical protein
MVIGTNLFVGDGSRFSSLQQLLDLRASGMKRSVNDLPEAEFSKRTDDDVARLAVGKATLRALAIEWDKVTSSVTEAGARIRATKSIPFIGDKSLWQAQLHPSPIRPFKGELKEQHVLVGIEVPVDETDQAREYLDQVMKLIPEFIDLHRAQVARHNGRLTELALPLVQERRHRLRQADALRNSLG